MISTHRFVGEQGVDAGGLKKEFFQLLVPQLFDPVVGMFSTTANEEVFFNAACDWYLDEYELAGLLVGLAVYNSVVLEVRLPVVAYKKLLHAGAHTPEFEPSLSDLAELDGDLAKGLRQLLAFDGDVENTFCRTFEDDDPARLQAVWKSTSELGYFHAVEHVGRPKFDFHTGYGARRSS